MDHWLPQFCPVSTLLESYRRVADHPVARSRAPPVGRLCGRGRGSPRTADGRQGRSGCRAPCSEARRSLHVRSGMAEARGATPHTVPAAGRTRGGAALLPRRQARPALRGRPEGPPRCRAARRAERFAREGSGRTRPRGRARDRNRARARRGLGRGDGTCRAADGGVMHLAADHGFVDSAANPRPHHRGRRAWATSPAPGPARPRPCPGISATASS